MTRKNNVYHGRVSLFTEYTEWLPQEQTRRKHMKPKSILISLMIILLTGISISSYAKGDDEPHHNSPHAMRNHHAHMQEMHTMLMNVMLILGLSEKPIRKLFVAAKSLFFENTGLFLSPNTLFLSVWVDFRRINPLMQDITTFF